MTWFCFPERLSELRVVAYVYEGGCHCDECAEDKFGEDVDLRACGDIYNDIYPLSLAMATEIMIANRVDYDQDDGKFQWSAHLECDTCHERLIEEDRSRYSISELRIRSVLQLLSAYISAEIVEPMFGDDTTNSREEVQ